MIEASPTEDAGVLVGVDVGGTFTDAVVVHRGRVVTAKVPSTPDDQSAGVIAAVGSALGRAGLEPPDVDRLAHGMTVGTNALLEGTGAPTALLATEGFADLLELRRQTRAHLYRLDQGHPPPLVPAERAFEVRERVTPEGVLTPLDEASLADAVARVRRSGAEAVAVGFLFSFAHPDHERRAADALRAALPGVHVSASSEVLPEFREYERLSTTAVDAYLTPVLRRYLRRLGERAQAAGLPAPAIMQSNGGVLGVDAAAEHAAWTVLSGPAAGVIGAAHLAARAGEPRVLTFDMGGTSCDVALVEGGEPARTVDTVIAGHPLHLEMLDVQTVSAGGGSIAWADPGGALRVGPRSAGARPGPAAYALGGSEPTVTDANVVLGRLPLDAPLGGAIRLDPGRAEAAVAGLARRLGMTPGDCAEGILAVAVHEMARALRLVSVERGVDPRGMALLAFGGAGPLHACAVAEELGMRRVLAPRAAGLLAALGLVVAGERRDYVLSVLAPVAAGAGLADRLEPLLRRAGAELPGAGHRASADCRYAGQSHHLTVPWDPAAPEARLAGDFHAAHRRRYGDADEGRPVEAVSLRLAAERPGARPALRAEAGGGDGGGAGPRAHGRGGVLGGARLVVPGGRRRHAGAGARLMDPVTLQVMANALRAVTEEMEAAMVRSAYSPNIKERRDCSTALFDAGGRMVVQAASIPVHLGAMPEAVAAVRARGAAPGEVWLLNDPYRGGTHLPDLTLVSPVPLAGAVAAYAVTRAHHADVGGMAPGSMPAGSRELLQEGLVIPPVRLVAGGAPAPDVMALVLANTRTPGEREGDLRAQLAAHRLADARLAEVAARQGAARVREAFAALLEYAERRARAAIAAMPDGTWRAQEALEGDGVTDEDLWIRVAVTIAGDALRVDFTGTDPAGPGNCNCPLAVTRSAVYFVVRCVTDPDIPASAGAFAPVEVVAPPGTLVNALPPAAVAGGNVETSSRIVDAVFAALGGAMAVPAQGQGTMNNVTLGGPGFTYYETLGGGQGASPGADGPSAVHVAMSNTLNTPVEALETAYPLRVEAYRVRRGTGGAGTHRGGDGVERRLRALAAAEASVIAERRRRGPSGRAGGADGAPGRTTLNGEPLPAKWSGRLRPGDVLGIETPGGGGYGPPPAT